MKLTIINKYYDKAYRCWVRDLVVETPNYKHTYVMGGQCWKRIMPAGVVEVIRIAIENGTKIRIERLQTT